MSLNEYAYLGENVSLICKNDIRTFYKVQDSTGEGVMTSYSVFPGVNLIYHDFHMENCISYFKPSVDMLCIDHCREGRLEWEMDDSSFLYVEAGDLQINSRVHHSRRFFFPLKHYHGVNVSICVEEFALILPKVLEGFNVDLYKLKEKFCSGKKPFIMRAGASIEHIFSELYSVPEEIRLSFYKIKVLELLLFLYAQEVPSNCVERPYFYKTQVEKIKAIMALITAKPHRHYTLQELSNNFNFPITAMKSCFKGVYGTTIYAYIKEYRMNTAAVRLRQTRDSITSIALQMGYNNASKFSAAFKSIIGMTPAEYRKSVV